jgi:hypothetical protein
MSLLSFCQWLASTPGSIALIESQYMYSVVESIHVITLALFLGTLSIVDLRMLGVALRRVPVGHVASALLPWTIAGFVVMVISGVLLFYAIPVRSYQSIFFRVKVLLLIVAGLNMWRYHRAIHSTVATWGVPGGVIPKAAKLAAGVSLAAWIGVVFAGRMIAYNWFDCDRPQSAFIYWAAGCVPYSEEGEM